MKILSLFFVIFAIFASSAYGLKNAICGLESARVGNGVINCAAYMPSWTYKQSENSCVQFVYGGCGGNENRFPTQVKCEEMCKE